MTKRRVGGLIALTLLGCGRLSFDETVSADTRLEQRAYDFEGNRQRGNTYDRERGEVCVPLRWADETIYCTPDRVSVRYADAGCSIPVGWSQGTDTNPYRYYVSTALDGRVETLWRATQSLSPTEYYANTFGSCTGPYPSTNVHWSLEEVPRSELAMLAETSKGSGRFVQRFATGHGISVPIQVYDTELSLPCELSVNGFDKSQLLCMPLGTPVQRTATYYADAACTQPAATYPGTGTPSHFSVQTCGNEPGTLHENLGQAPVLFDADQGCSPIGTTGTIFRIGPALDAGVGVTIMSSTGHRVENVTVELPSLVTGSGWMRDTMWDVACIPAAGEPGDVVPCQPAPQPAYHLYRDAGCTMPIYVMLVEACGSPRVPVIGLLTSTAALHRVGPLYTGTLFSLAGASCQPLANGGTILYYELAEAITYEPALGTIVIEPPMR